MRRLHHYYDGDNMMEPVGPDCLTFLDMHFSTFFMMIFCGSSAMHALVAQEGNYALAQTFWMKLLENGTNQDNNAIHPDQITFNTLLKHFTQ
jgi:hypothetical protein